MLVHAATSSLPLPSRGGNAVVDASVGDSARMVHRLSSSNAHGTQPTQPSELDELRHVQYLSSVLPDQEQALIGGEPDSTSDASSESDEVRS